MTILYNCRHDGDQYRITKFDDDMNPQGSYLVDAEACECPAGVRPTCRHRAMLPKFISRNHVGDEWFFDYDRGGWVQLGEEWKWTETQTALDWEMVKALEADGEKLRQLTGEDHGPVFLEESGTISQEAWDNLPEGITAIVMDTSDKVVDVHNAIADAVGEPELRLAPTHIKRRF